MQISAVKATTGDIHTGFSRRLSSERGWGTYEILFTCFYLYTNSENRGHGTLLAKLCIDTSQNYVRCTI